MEWLEVKINVNNDNADAIEGILLNNGLTGYIINDPNEFTAFIEDENRAWDYIDDGLLNSKKDDHSIIFYVTATADGYEQLNAISTAVKALDNSIVLTNRGVLDTDWETAWKKHYKPFEVGETIIVKPSWESYENKDNKIIIEMDPGLAFGTGTHESTRLCMEAIERLADGEMANALDLGCGSGILGVTLHKMGVNHIRLVDIDYNARDIVKNNFALNGIYKECYDVYIGNLLEDTALYNELSAVAYDFIAVNIVADIIIMHMDLMYDMLKEGGIIVSGGIINERSDDVYNAFIRKGFHVLKVVTLNSWTSISVRK